MKHVSPISGIAVNNHYVATAGYDNKVIIWDRATFKSISVGYHDHLANQCEFSVCGKFLITSSSDYSARLWQVPDMKLIKVFTMHNDDVEFATFDQSTSRVATASRDNNIAINNIYNDQTKILVGHEADVLSVCFVKESLISSSDDGTIRKWDIVTGENTILTKSDFQTDTIAINGEIVFAGDDAGFLYIINGECTVKIKAHDSGVKRLYFFCNDQLLVSMAYDRQCILWKFKDGVLKEIHRFNLPSIVWPRSCAVYENFIYFATFGSSFGVYDYVKQQWKLNHIMDTNGINAIGLYNNHIYKIGDSGKLKMGKQLIYSTNSLSNFIIQCYDKMLAGGQNGQLINTTDGQIIFQYKSPLNCAIFFDDKLYIGTYTGEILIFDNLSCIPVIVSLHNNAIKDIINLDKYIISVCANGEICKYDILLNQKFTIQGHNNIINGCAKFDDNSFVTVSRDKKIIFWDINTLNCVNEINTPHSHSIKVVAVSEDSKLIASGSYNGTIYLFNPETEEWVKNRVTTAGISCIKYDKNNNQFVAGSYDGNLYFLQTREVYNEYQ